MKIRSTAQLFQSNLNITLKGTEKNTFLYGNYFCELK